jgi:glutathione S-transferase
MKFYTNPYSTNCRRVALTAKQAGVSLDEKVLDFAKGEHKGADFLAVNPMGRLPAFVDGDLFLNESRAIVSYIASQAPKARLGGETPKEQAAILRWQFFDACHFAPPLGTLILERLLKPRMGIGEPSEAAITDAITRFEPVAKVLDAELKGRDWLVGGRLTVADLTLASSMMYAEVTGMPLEAYPNLRSWFGRVRELDGWRATEPKFE